MFQLPPGIISSVMTPDADYTPMDHSLSPSGDPSASQLSPGLSTLSPPSSRGSYSVDNGERKGSFSLNQISDETLSQVNSHLGAGESKTQVMWELKQEAGEGIQFQTGSGVESFSTQPMDISYNNTNTSQSLTNDVFLSGNMAVSQSNPNTSPSIVSQFLQNISLALKASDPMFNQTVPSNRTLHHNDLTITSSPNNVVMSADRSETSLSHSSHGSLLKDVLTCATVSLDNMYLPSLQVTAGSKTSQRSMDTSEMLDMDVHIDSTLKSLLTQDSMVNTGHNINLQNMTSGSSLSAGMAGIKDHTTQHSDLGFGLSNTIDLTQGESEAPGVHQVVFSGGQTGNMHTNLQFSNVSAGTILSQVGIALFSVVLFP